MGKPKIEYSDGITTERQRGASPVGVVFGGLIVVLAVWGIITLLVGESRKTPDHIVALYVVIGIALAISGGCGVFLLMRFLILHMPNKDYMSPDAVMMVQEATKREIMAMMSQNQPAQLSGGGESDQWVKIANNTMIRRSDIEMAADHVYVALYPHAQPTRENIGKILDSTNNKRLRGRSHNMIASIQSALCEMHVAEGGGTPGSAYRWKEQ